MTGKRKRSPSGFWGASTHLAATAARHFFKRRKLSHKKKKKSASDGGAGSTGDMNKVIWKKKGGKRQYRRFRKFKKKVEKALESDLPLGKVLFQQSSARTKQNSNQFDQFAISEGDIGELKTILQQITQTAQAGTYFTQRYHMFDLHIDGYYTNCGNTVCCLDWYTVVPRTDNINDPFDDWLQAASDTTVGEILSPAGQQVSVPNQNTVGANPFMFSQYCCKWLILSKRRVILQPGETKEFRFHRYYNKTIDGARFQQGGTSYKALKGITKYHHIFINGQPVHDQSVATTVGLAPFRVDFAWTKTYTARALSSPNAATQASKTQFFLAQAFPTVTTPKTVEEFNPANVVTAVNN